MNEENLEQDVKDILYKFGTHTNRFKNLIKSLMEYDTELDTKIICHLLLTNIELREDYIRLLRSKKEDLIDLAELIELIGKDLQDFGERAIKNDEYYLKKLEELENK